VSEVQINWRRPDYRPVWIERAERLAEIRKDPTKMVPALWGHYKDHPAAFISDWGVTFDPRLVELGLEATAPFMLFSKQEEFVDWVIAKWRGRQDAVVEKSRDMGVSWLCVAVAVWMWTFHPGAVVGFGSRKEDYVDKIGDPASLFWKVRMFIGLLPPEFRPAGYDEKKHAPFMRVLNPISGAAIVGEAGDNIGRGNRTSLYFVDEAAFLEHPDAVDAALSQTTNCRIDVSTPNGEGNPFWRKRFGGKLPVFTFDWRDDPRKDADWYARQVAKLDPVVVAQEIDRNYSASVSNAFIDGAVVSTAMSRGPADIKPMGPLRVGVDVARFGDDKTVLTFRRGRVVTRISSWGKTDLMSTAGRVKQEVQTYVRGAQCHLEQIAVDTIGLGAGVADALRGWFTSPGLVVDVDSSRRLDDGENYNLRARMWADMRDWLEIASLPNDQDLRADLTALRYSYRQGLLLLEAKDDAKKRGIKSPDRADSLALTFAIPGGPKAPTRIPSAAVVDYPVDAEIGL
jgi:hypothetical protein